MLEAIRPSHIAALMNATENSITVKEIASTDLWWADPAADSSETCAFMRAHEYDVAPLQEMQPYRFVAVADLTGSGPVSTYAKPIDAAHMVSTSLGLAEGVIALKTRAFYFLLDGHRLSGVVTRSDVQRPAVSMVTLSLILICEAGLNQVIPSWMGATWAEQMPLKRRRHAEENLAQRRRYNASLGLRDCLFIEDRLALVAKNRELLSELGFESRRKFEAWSNRLSRLRDVLAHAGSILHHEPDPECAIVLFSDVRDFARRTWQLVDKAEASARGQGLSS